MSVPPILAPTEAQVYAVMRNLLLTMLPATVPIIRGQVNRAPEPHNPDFLVYWPIRRDRLATNERTTSDVILTASVALTTMTVTAITGGSLVVGAPLTGTGVATDSVVTAFGTGTGGIGTYTIAPSQTLSSRTIYAGLLKALQKTELTIQLDVHGPNSADYAQIISTLFRDEYSTSFFSLSGVDAQPLYADDPKQVPFVNAEAQYENRWTLDVCLEANILVSTGQQFADQVTTGLIEVDTTYPP